MKLLKLFILIAILLCGHPVPAANMAQFRKPNLDISTYRRSFTTDEPIVVRLSAYNESGVSISVYRLDLEALVPSSDALGNLGPRIAALDLERMTRVRTFPHGLGKVYPDTWTEQEVAVPHLPPGIYLLSARGAGVEKRTWIMVTDVSLVAKRSRQELLVFATDARSGKPIPSLALTTLDSHGRRTHGATDGDGLWRSPLPQDTGGVWVTGTLGGSPANVLTGGEAAPDPFSIVTYTDRPVYRPGHTVQFKTIIRSREDAVAPGGFVYHPYAGKPAIVEIRDATDALVSRKRLQTNAYGSLADSLQLASEPTLGTWHIVTVIGDHRTYADFSVEDYRKPEFTGDVTFDRAHYFNGDTITARIGAKYYFGQPVTGAHVQYTVSFSASPQVGQDGSRGTEPDFTGDAETDRRGEVIVTIPTKRIPVDRNVTVAATVTDLSRRSQSCSESTTIAAGRFQLSMSCDRELYRPGETIALTAHARDYDDHPVSTKVRVEFTEILRDRQHRSFRETTTRDVTTSSRGDATATFRARRPNDLAVAVEAYDQDGDKIRTESDIWVVGDDYPDYNFPTLRLVADKGEYRPGDTATLMLNTNLVTPPGTPEPVMPKGQKPPRRYGQAWALITVEGERLYKHFLLPLKSRSTTFQVPVDALYFPSISIDATIVQEKHIYEEQARLSVRRDEPDLKVTVTPDREHYRPGDPASYTITTRDWQGRPVPAEVSLGVVDASIYAVQPDATPALRSVFYGGQEVRIDTSFSFAAQYSGGAYQTVPAPSGNGQAQGSVRLRRQFADTALWSPFVTTDASGTAKVSLDLPDNLTAWRATARGITLGTQVGEAMHDVTSSLPLMARLALPRFYVAGDKTVVSAVVQNATKEDRTINVHLVTEGITLDGSPDRTLTLTAGEQKRLDWTATVGSGPTALVRVSASGGGDAKDAMETTLPVEPDGLKMADARNGVLRDDGDTFRQSLDTLPHDATVTLTLSPTLASSLLGSLKDLTEYPYGCAEQTMSGFLPDVIVARTLHKLGDKRTVVPNLDGWVSLGIQKLYRYQHADGGWHWWEDDQSDPEMTAYVLWGLAQAQGAGYTVDDQRLARGAAAVLRFLSDEKDESTRAEYLVAITAVNPNAAEMPLRDLYAHRSRLDRFGKASLVLALRQAGGKMTPLAANVADELKGGLKRHGGLAWWPSEEGGYSWHADDVFVTAHTLRAVLAADPNWDGAPDVAAWLMAQRQGNSWESTRTSAEAVYALAEYLGRTNELHPNYDAEITLDGAPLKTVHVTSASLSASTIVLTPAQIAGHHEIAVRKTDAGVLYAEAMTRYTLPPDQAKPLDRGVAVHRHYTVTADDPSQAGTVSTRSDIAVEVDLQSDGQYPYVMLEEPIPAGCEIAPDDEGWQSGGTYFRREARDNKVVFFFDTLPKGQTTVTYHLHTETPGSYRILPSIAQLVYHPEVRGNTGLARTNIAE